MRNSYTKINIIMGTTTRAWQGGVNNFSHGEVGIKLKKLYT
jgi:hypothetical protein